MTRTPSPQPKIGRWTNPVRADLKERRRAEVEGSKATLPSRTCLSPFLLKV